MPINHGKYANGNGTKYNTLANGVNGMAKPINIIREVEATTGAEAQLCIKGTFLVLMMCIINVCDNRPTTNQLV